MFRHILLCHRSSVQKSSPQWIWPIAKCELSPWNFPTETHGITRDPTNIPFQVRWKRKDGHSAFHEQRKTTRKQKKEYRRRQRELFYHKVAKHSPPNSKANIRREEAAQERQNYLNWKDDDTSEFHKYGYEDLLLDDLMGSSANLGSSPTPQPLYYGNKHDYFHEKVEFQLKRYRESIAKIETMEEQNTLQDSLDLPTDKDISLLVRSFRDKNGTRLKPVGVAKVLEYLLKDLQLPISSFGQKTFSSILTCCITPAEARRIFRLMNDTQHPISSHCWSILVDIHAKLGDFQGCDAVMREMVEDGVTPSLPAYTSLLAACYKVCNSGIIPYKIRKEAGELAWAKWKEMRILGVEADVMAFGAILRICAARGKAEQALNLLDEMSAFQVKPTTLCFSSALKAIARSHEVANRFENGTSPHYRRRQQVASYHGRMARKVVIAAESSEVELDDGFISSLILCAGAAGDSATAKAILLASEVRRLDHLRTIGPESQFSQLLGQGQRRPSPKGMEKEKSPSLFLSPSNSEDSDSTSNELASSTTGSVSIDGLRNADHAPKTYWEREYGKDSRVLSALMLACSQAIDSRGLGTMWEGRDNKGYLCEGSLLGLERKPTPRYMDNSIPGVSDRTVALGSLTYDEEDTDIVSKRLRRAKFRGVDIDDSGSKMDELDPYFYDMYKHEDPRLTQGNPDARKEVLPLDDPAWDIRVPENTITSDVETPTARNMKEEWFFDINERKWKCRLTEELVSDTVDNSEKLDQYSGKGKGHILGENSLFFKASSGEVTMVEDKYQEAATGQSTEEWFFDQTERKWKTQSSVGASKDVQPNLTKYEVDALASRVDRPMIPYPKSNSTFTDFGAQQSSVAPKLGFEKFVGLLKKEIKDSGDDLTFTDVEARELYEMMDGKINMFEEDEGSLDNFVGDSDPSKEDHIPSTALDDEEKELMQLMKSMGMDVSADATDSSNWLGEEENEDNLESVEDDNEDETERVLSPAASVDKITSSNDMMTAHPVHSGRDYMVEELQTILPGMPERRLRLVAKEFRSNLGYPSLLTLTPLLRENLPERVTSAWLQRKNVQNASFVMQKATEDGLVDVHMMNGMLQVECSTGSIDRALACHEVRFEQVGLKPTRYSDRLVLGMLVKNHRLSRALAFKEKIQLNGRTLDVLSYGILIEYYAKHRQIGSALMMLKECVRVNGAPPNEYSLNVLRRLCRHQHLTEKTGLVHYAGPDPLEWLREGEAKFKREFSKKGRRDVLLPRNKSVHI